jgi:Chaperone for flagella basal body P-ring formation
MMLPVLWIVFSMAAGCLSIEGERITAKDLSRAVPEFAGLPEGVSLGFAPLPGARRGLTGADIQRIATQYGIRTESRDSVCFEWPMHRLERSEVLRAMRDALGHDGVELEDFSLFAAPPGTIVFPLTGLNRQPKGTSFWRGYVQYGGGKRFNVWAKVKLDASVASAATVDVIGGSRVTVLVRSGTAELKLDAQAITSGSKGQTVTIRNPRSGRSFAAEVTGKDTVVVEAGPAQGETQK